MKPKRRAAYETKTTCISSVSSGEQLYANGGSLAEAAETLEGVGGAVSGTPAAASALAGLYAGMGEAEKAAAVVVKAAEDAHRGKHVSVHNFQFSVCRHICFYIVTLFVVPVFLFTPSFVS